MTQRRAVDNRISPDASIVSLIESLSMLRALVLQEAGEFHTTRVCQNAADRFIEHRDIHACAVYLSDGEDSQRIALARRDTPSAQPSQDSRLPQGAEGAIVAATLASGTATSLPDLAATRHGGFGSLIATPITAGGTTMGVMLVWHAQPGRFAPWHERLMVLCSDILGQMLLNGQLLKGREDTITQRDRELDQAGTSLQVERELRSAAEAAMEAACQQRSRQAMVDSLTGLSNRHGFDRRLEAAIANALNEGAQYGLLFLDIDRFKIINDIGGHMAGDRLMQTVAGLLKQQFTVTSNLARLGNDEFAVLLESHNAEAALKRANALCDAIERMHFSSADQRFVISVSIGVVAFPAQGNTVEALMRKVTAACTAAQDQGGGKVQMFEENNSKMLRRASEARALAQFTAALDEDRLELHCQPIVATQSPDIESPTPPVDYEILVRMRDDKGELVQPGQFLPFAERLGLSVKLDRWVVNRVLRTLEAHPDAVQRIGHVAINLSGHSIGNKGFLDYVIDLLDTTEVSAEKICFEVTETVAISDLETARSFMLALKARGCRFSIDDFGSGHASYLYLRDLPAEYLKIDGEFVQKIANDPISLHFVRSINDIAQITGKSTIAEYVENGATLALLRNIGIDLVQGYFVGRPRPLEDMLRATE